MPALPPYPTILTDAEWKKQKGLVAKLAGPTDLGGELRDAEGAYKAVPWQVVLAGAKLAAPLKVLDDRIFKAKGEFKTKYDTLKDFLQSAKKAAVKVQADWAKNKLMPKDNKAYIDNVVKAVDPFWAKVDHETQAAFKVLTDARAKSAADNPDAAAASSSGVITKQKPPAAPPAPGGAKKAAVADQAAPKLKFKAPGAPPAPTAKSGA